MQFKYQAEVIWRATSAGAFQRSNIYADNNASDPKRRPVKDAIKRYLCSELFPAAVNGGPMSAEKLDQWIEELRTRLEANHKPLLRDATFQYGNAQKFVNLFLKYMWVMGLSAEPPHFPVDAVIQKSIPKFKFMSWTDMSRDQYQEVIEAACTVAKSKGQSLAQWELEAYALTGHA